MVVCGPSVGPSGVRLGVIDPSLRYIISQNASVCTDQGHDAELTLCQLNKVD